MSDLGTIPEMEERIKGLENENALLIATMQIMKEDLSIKDEQFEFLYSSLRARTEQSKEEEVSVNND